MHIDALMFSYFKGLMPRDELIGIYVLGLFVLLAGGYCIKKFLFEYFKTIFFFKVMATKKVFLGFCDFWEADIIVPKIRSTEKAFKLWKFSFSQKTVVWEQADRLSVLKGVVFNFTLPALLAGGLIKAIELLPAEEIYVQSFSIATIFLIFYAVMALPVVLYQVVCIFFEFLALRYPRLELNRRGIFKLPRRREDMVEIFLSVIRPNAFFYIPLAAAIFAQTNGLLLPVESLLSNLVTIVLLLIVTSGFRVLNILLEFAIKPVIFFPVFNAAFLLMGGVLPFWYRWLVFSVGGFTTMLAMIVIAVTLRTTVKDMDVEHIFNPLVFMFGLGLVLGPLIMNIIASHYCCAGYICQSTVKQMTLLMAMPCSTVAYIVIERFLQKDAETYINAGTWITALSPMTVYCFLIYLELPVPF